jgi:hypothetical protein
VTPIFLQRQSFLAPSDQRLQLISRQPIASDDEISIPGAITQFQSCFLHLSVNPGSFHGKTIRDFALFGGDHLTACMDYFLFHSQEIPHGTRDDVHQSDHMSKNAQRSTKE